MIRRLATLALVLVAAPLSAGMLPGFSLEMVAPSEGFLSSIAFDEAGVLHYTTTGGSVFRVEQGVGHEIVRLETAVAGNSALLGMAFTPDGSIVVHYVSRDLTADVISRIDPLSGDEEVIARLQCSPGGEPCPTEHHGGNPAVAPDGTIFVGIGDYGLPNIAQREDVFAAKIFRISTGGSVERVAMGFRNPFDLQWDSAFERIIATENGPTGDDEVLFVEEGQNHGWPLTMGSMPPVDGMTPPTYVFPGRTAPTGIDILEGTSGWFRQGILVTSFVTRALYYFPWFDESSLAPPMEIVNDETMELIDVRQSPSGEIFIASGSWIYRVVPPVPGDANGDGEISREDRDALLAELEDHTGGATVHAQEGEFRASWGADANQDGVIDRRDLAELSRLLSNRGRAIRHPSSSSRMRPLTGGRSD